MQKRKRKRRKRRFRRRSFRIVFYIYKRRFLFSFLNQVHRTTVYQNVEFWKGAPIPKKSGTKRPSEKAKLPTEKASKVAKKDTSKTVPDAVSDSKTESLKNKESEIKNCKVVVDRLSTEKESPNETRKSPRVKKRPADDTSRKSSRKGKPKKRKECSFLYLDKPKCVFLMVIWNSLNGHFENFSVENPHVST